MGKETAINQLLPQAEVIYLHYSANNLKEYDSRLDLKPPIISVIDRLTERIQNTNKIVNVQVGLFRLEVEDFSEKALWIKCSLKEYYGWREKDVWRGIIEINEFQCVF